MAGLDIGMTLRAALSAAIVSREELEQRSDGAEAPDEEQEE